METGGKLWKLAFPRSKTPKDGVWGKVAVTPSRAQALQNLGFVRLRSKPGTGFIHNLTTENEVQREWTSLFVLERFLCVLFNFNSIDILFALWNPLLQTVMNMNISFDCWWTEGKI